MKRIRWWPMTAVFVLAGCVGTEAPPMHAYALQLPAVKRVHASPYGDKVIKVSFPLSFRESIGDKMLYSYSAEERGVYLNSRWANNLGKMLQGTVMEVLERSGMFKAVLPYSSAAGGDLRLESMIYDFSHHIRGRRSFASVSMQFSLIDSRTGKLVRTRRFDMVEETSTTDAKGYVEATNRIVRRLSAALIDWLAHGDKVSK